MPSRRCLLGLFFVLSILLRVTLSIRGHVLLTLFNLFASFLPYSFLTYSLPPSLSPPFPFSSSPFPSELAIFLGTEFERVYEIEFIRIYIPSLVNGVYNGVTQLLSDNNF